MDSKGDTRHDLFVAANEVRVLRNPPKRKDAPKVRYFFKFCNAVACSVERIDTEELYVEYLKFIYTMKKKTLKMAVAAMVVAAAGYGLFLNQNKDNGMSELALANVEALANNEANSNGNTGPSELFDCPLWFTGDGIHCLCQNSNPCTAVLCD